MTNDQVKYQFGFIALLLLSGCTGLTLRNASTQELVEKQLQLTKKVVFFSSSLSPEAIRDRILQQPCGTEETTLTTVAQAGPGLMVPVGSRFHFSVDSGAWPDGSLWVAMRMDSMLHATPSGVKLVHRTDGGSDVSVLAADAKKVTIIKQRVEEGTLFCHWREFDYPHD